MSCPCNECNHEQDIIKSGVKSNLGVYNCRTDEFICKNNYIFGTEKQKEKQGISYLNPQVYTDKLEPHFYKTESGLYTSQNPKMYDQARMIRMEMTEPPVASRVRMRNIYKDELTNYGSGFNTYENIKDGMIRYYVDNSIAPAYHGPNFVSGTEYDKIMYRDPMGSIKPQYDLKVDFVNRAMNTVNEDNLSFITDTQRHREDIMSFQMAKMNSQKWTARWGEN